MTGILSSISSYFSKSLILGTFLPVIVFVLLFWLLAVPLLPADLSFIKPLEALDAQWKVLAALFLTILLTGLLYNLNIPLIRLYEGYPWQDWWVGELRRGHFRRQFASVQARWLGMPQLQQELGRLNQNDERILKIQDKLVEAGQVLNTEFPRAEELVLPTRLGNVIRSFESYPRTRYGIESITVWPRLIAKVSESYAGAIDGAKTSFDFMLNCSALSAALGFVILSIGLLYPTPLAKVSSAEFWLSEIIVLWVMAYFLYFLLVGRAGAWGELVKGAFDLYRWELLAQLGYDREVARTAGEESALWRNISNRMIFGEYRLTPPAEYAPAKTFAKGEDDTIRLEVGRGISPPAANGEVTVTLRVKNVGRFSATGVVVTDTLPSDFQYVQGSAAVTNPDAPPGFTVTMAGANPYKFAAGPLRRRRELVVTYRALPFKAP